MFRISESTAEEMPIPQVVIGKNSVTTPTTKKKLIVAGKFSEIVIEIPRVLCSTKASFDLTIVNSNNSKLELQPLRRSCGCLNLAGPSPLLLEPGESKELTLTFAAPATPGEFLQDLLLNADESVVRFVCTGKVLPPVAFDRKMFSCDKPDDSDFEILVTPNFEEFSVRDLKFEILNARNVSVKRQEVEDGALRLTIALSGLSQLPSDVSEITETINVIKESSGVIQSVPINIDLSYTTLVRPTCLLLTAQEGKYTGKLIIRSSAKDLDIEFSVVVEGTELRFRDVDCGMRKSGRHFFASITILEADFDKWLCQPGVVRSKLILLADSKTESAISRPSFTVPVTVVRN